MRHEANGWDTVVDLFFVNEARKLTDDNLGSAVLQGVFVQLLLGGFGWKEALLQTPGEWHRRFCSSMSYGIGFKGDIDHMLFEEVESL